MQDKINYLSKRGYVLRKENYKQEELSLIKKELTAKPLTDSKFNTNNAVPVNFPVYIETKTKLYIPKMYGINKFGFPPDVLENYEGKDWEHEIEFKGDLYLNQIEPVDILIKACKEKGGGILQAGTGTGKTFMALNVLSHLKCKTIVIVNKIALLNQWKEEANTFLPLARIGIIQGSKKIADVDECDIVIIMLQSLSRVDYPETLFKDFKCLIVDECFPYDTHIITSNSTITIGTLYKMKQQNKQLPTVKTYNEITKKFEYKEIINVFRKINNRLIEISCSKMKMKSTENHKYLILNNNEHIWVEANKLKINDFIVSNYDIDTLNTICPALNNDQYQILIGSFLGDGHIQTLKNGRFRLAMTHGKDQHDYCKWKASMFGINSIRYIKENGYSKKEAYQFATKTFYLFNELPKTKTSVPQWMLDDLDEKGLAIWFMDDGSINKKAFNINISTDSFDEDSQKRIIIKLNSIGIECKYINYKKTYYKISINEKGSKNLIRLIHRYIHKNILYKLLPQQYLSYLQDMSIITITNDTVFCKKENIKHEFLIQNKIYKIYNNYKKDDNHIHFVKYLFCKKCKKNRFHTFSKTYWNCNHNKKPIEILNMPIIFSNYIWNNTFLDYGYSKITKITKDIKNKSNNNYVFDMEIKDNHNYIVCNKNLNGFIVHNCHNLTSKVFSQTLFKLSSKYTIGLSATPKKSDGTEYVFKWHIGDIVFQSDEKRKGLPPIIRYLKIDTKDYKEISTTNNYTGLKQIQFTSMLSDLIQMPKRNLLVVELLKDLIKHNQQQILVIGDRREHLENIKTLLDNDLSVTFTNGLFLGGATTKKAEKRNEISRKCQVILATFKAFSEGVSEKNLDTLILITPKKFIDETKLKDKINDKKDGGGLTQLVGRIFRRDHIERNPIIIDFCDNFSVYKSQFNSRKIFYKQHFTNGIFENSSINLDDHDDVKIDYIKTKKITKEKEKKKVTDIDNTIDKFTTCIIND